ncbi:hypothetical protein ACLB2K_044657 [Fragaria x ananassa]
MATMSRPMASRSNRVGRGHAFPVDSPSFCLKIVTGVDLQDGKELPEPAVRKYGNCMEDSIFLKNIPAHFTIKNLCGIGSSCNVTLQIEGKRTWTVLCSVSKCGLKARFNPAGWKAFVKDNQLEAGDHCRFELIGELKLKVVIS